MKLLSHNKMMNVLASVMTGLVFLSNPLVEAHSLPHAGKCNQCQFSTPHHYLPEYPWIGLIMDEVTYGPITVSNVHINKGDRLAIVKPGEVLHGDLRYRVDSTDQKLLHRYHLVVGLKNIGAQDCVTHTYGVWDSKGKGTFTLKAPFEPGLYEVRFFYVEAPTCEEARSVWNNEIGTPSAFATIGAIIVEE